MGPTSVGNMGPTSVGNMGPTSVVGNMGPTSVGGCPWLIYALQGKLNNSCELVSCLRQGLYLVAVKRL